MVIREEQPGDTEAIRALVSAAFLNAEHSSGTEAAIVDALRTAAALTVTLVAVEADDIVGHVAFSPVDVDGAFVGWYGLGPVAVQPQWQGQGVGQALIREGLERLRHRGARGCVVLGDPGYYGRFGFRADSRLRLADVPPEYFQCLALADDTPQGNVEYHPGFYVSG